MPAVGSPRYEAARLYEEAVIRRSEGNVSGAFARYRRVLEIAEAEGDAEWQAETVAEVGRMYQEAFHLLEARRWHQRALALYQELELPPRVVRTLGWLAEVAQLSGDPAAAESLFREALAGARQAVDAPTEALLRAGLAQLLWETRRQSEGAAELVTAFLALRELDSPEAERVRARALDWKQRSGSVRHRQLIHTATQDPAVRELLTT